MLLRLLIGVDAESMGALWQNRVMVNVDGQVEGAVGDESVGGAALLQQAWWCGVRRVAGRATTRHALAAIGRPGCERIDAVLAIGKAAAAMCLGALEWIERDCPALVVARYGRLPAALGSYPGVEVIQAAHPVPDQNSLLAGARVRRFVAAVPPQGHLLVLVSGGASALVEVLIDGVTLDDLQAINRRLMAYGWDIGQISRLRIRLSAIKGGRLLGRHPQLRKTILAISDVPGDAPDDAPDDALGDAPGAAIETIGSGIGCPYPVAAAALDLPAWLDVSPTLAARLTLPVAVGDGAVPGDGNAEVRIIASNRHARTAAADFIRRRGLRVVENQQTLHQDVRAAAAQVVERLLAGPPGVYIWGGEPTVVLPPRPGRGGRNQTLALAIACGIRGHRAIDVIAAATDGVDGPTDAAGGLVNGQTVRDLRSAQAALDAADAGTYLDAAGALFVSRPTATNVMDLVIACKRPPVAGATPA